MDQRLSLITLGVRDLATARSFYEDLGWKTGAGADDDVVFFQAGAVVIALWDRDRLAEDSCVDHDEGGWGGVTLAYNVGSRKEVDLVMEEAHGAGRRSAARPPRPSGAATPACSSTPTATRGRSRTTRTGASPTTAASS